MIEQVLVGLGELPPPRIECPPALGIDQPTDLFGESRQARFAVAVDGQIDLVEAAEILVVGP